MKKLILFLFLISVFSSLQAAKHQKVFRTVKLQKADTCWIFTPANYDANPGKQYPVVFLLHGWSGNYHQWDDIMGCQSYADKYDFILVCPDGLYDSWYINSPALPNSQFEDFFMKELEPYVSKEFRTDKKNFFITGLSMGGHGALYLFSRYPDFFCSAGSLSGAVDLNNCSTSYGIKEHFGLKEDASDKAILDKYSVEYSLESIQKSGKEIIFSCGTSDFFYDINNQLRKSCDKMGIKATYITSPGGHDYTYWKANINAQLLFFSERLSK